MLAADILRFWEQHHGELSAELRQAFLEREAAKALTRYPTEGVRKALSRHRELRRALAEVRGNYGVTGPDRTAPSPTVQRRTSRQREDPPGPAPAGALVPREPRPWAPTGSMAMELPRDNGEPDLDAARLLGMTYRRAASAANAVVPRQQMLGPRRLTSQSEPIEPAHYPTAPSTPRPVALAR